MDCIYTHWIHLLLDLDQPWISRPLLQTFTEVIRGKGADLKKVWGFIDGTIRPIFRPGKKKQCMMYNGRMKVHSIKFQFIATPNGLIASLYGPVEGKSTTVQCWLDPKCWTSFKRKHLVHSWWSSVSSPTALSESVSRRYVNRPSKSLEQVNERVSVEWIFGDVVKCFEFLDFKRNSKICSSAIEKMCILCTLLLNLGYVYMHGTTTSAFFQIFPPTVYEYFQ